MIEQPLLLKLSSFDLADNSTSQLRKECQVHQRLFRAQKTLVQQYLAAQAASIADAIVQGAIQIRFAFPDYVSCIPAAEDCGTDVIVPIESRQQTVGGWIERLNRADLLSTLRDRLAVLEHSSNPGISASSSMLGYAIATHMVYNLLPAGKSVVYKKTYTDDIPNQPFETDDRPGYSFTPDIEPQGLLSQKENTFQPLVVPYVEYARRFFLPQWVAFDDLGKLISRSLREAEACIASLQKYLAILNSAVVIAPYMIADEMWQKKRYGVMGQLVNQGRAYGYYQIQEIIQTINRRIAAQNLNRGLSLSLPYFNDRTLEIEEYNFEVIPAGRIMFVPAFVVLSVRAQAAKVAEQASFSLSTRRHLLMELSVLEKSFLRY